MGLLGLELVMESEGLKGFVYYDKHEAMEFCIVLGIMSSVELR